MYADGNARTYLIAIERGVLPSAPFRSMELPAAWDEATVDGLLDLELLMTDGPEPTLTAAAGGRDILFLPGPDEGDRCY